MKEKQGMWKPFQPPGFNPKIFRRKFADEVLYALDELAQALATRGRSMVWGKTLPDHRAYGAAIRRLRKQGLIAYRRPGGRAPGLLLTEEGKKKTPEAARPRRFWDRKWDGTWYVLVFDIPESNRSYRFALRGFMRRMRMGCLQRSVWISPRDIRPEYQDLDEAAAAREYCFLFQARTVLGQTPAEVVRQAWPMDRIRKAHEWYLQVYAENLRRLCRETPSETDLHALLREERAAYLAAMEEDPLLPRSLWPEDYRGRQVYDLHRLLLDEIGRRL